MAVVVPHGVLFRGAAEGRIRRQLVDENLLDAVIGLPEKLFYGTGIPAAILLLRRHKRDDQVLFVDASRDFHEGKNQNLLRAQDLYRIVAACTARQEAEKYAHLATREQIAANDYNLNIPRYVSGYQPQQAVDLSAVRAEREKLKGELLVLEEKMASYLKELGYD